MDDWDKWPFLPLYNQRNGFKIGFLFALEEGKLYLGSYKTFLESELPYVEYKNYEDLWKDGWKLASLQKPKSKKKKKGKWWR